MKEAILISACLVGEKCRYDGTDSKDDALLDSLSDNKLIPICPEELGGLTTPRPKAEILFGTGVEVIATTTQVMDEFGANVTDKFIKGAEKTLSKALDNNVKKAYLKEKSPSCGVKHIYNDGVLVDGPGVTTALLMKNGIEVEGV